MLQHKRHSSPDVDDEKLRAAKAFLEQHLKQAGSSDAAGAAAAAAVVAAAAGGSKDRDKDRNKDRSKEKKEKVAGSLPPGVPLLTPEDYFERAAEFTAWLQEIKHQYFNGEACVYVCVHARGLVAYSRQYRQPCSAVSSAATALQ
jgi:hypothetical protein